MITQNKKVENTNSMKKALALLISFICYQIVCHAQVMDEHYYFKNLSVQNGLSQNTVNAILQDKQGFMWFGTKDGLNRYDGLSFRQFKHDGRSQRSIGNNFITALYEDAEGNIWVGTDVGLYIYYPENDSFRHFEELSAEGTKIEHTVTAIVGDDQGCVEQTGCEMKHVRMFVIILLVSAVTTVYGQERHGTETGTARLSIYKLPPVERAIRCTKYYEGWHGEKKHWPYVGWGHKVLPGESFTNDITKAQGDSILRADMMKLCRLFSRFGRDSTLLSCLAYQVGYVSNFIM